jgi:uncharacterized delta-60 repeat protein
MWGAVARQRYARGSIRGRLIAIAGGALTLAAVTGTALGAAGDLDSGFGTGGKVTTGITSSSTDSANAVAVQTDGKVVAAGRSGGSALGGDFAVVRYNANGTLDTGFGGDGNVTTDFGGGVDATARAVAIQSDGKIVVAGFTASDQVGGQGPGDFALARYNADGTLDTGFSGDGKLATDIDGGSGDQANAVAIQTDGKIVAAGASEVPNNKSDFALVRYNSGGALDPTFDMADSDGNGAGKVTTEFGADTPEVIQGIAIQASDQKIVAAGVVSDSDFNNPDFAIARYNTGGTLDTAGFGGGSGKVQDDLSGSGSNDDARGVAIQTTGEIVVAGGSDASGTDGNDFALVRYETDGDRDATTTPFGGDGLVTTDFGGTADGAEGVALDGTKIVAAGRSGNFDGPGDFAVARYESDGDLDTTTFGGGTGKATTDIHGSSNDDGHAVAVQTDSKVVVAGGVSSMDSFFGETGDFIVTRYTSAGALDTGWDGDGKADTLVGGGFNDRGLAAAVQGDGKIVVAGSTADETGVDDEDFAVVRFNANGTLDTAGFGGGDGIVSFDFGGLDKPDLANAVAIQPSDGKIVVAGFSEEGGDRDFAVARLNVNGTLDDGGDGPAGAGFGGGDGKVPTDFDTISSDQANGVAIQVDGKIVAAGRADASGNPEFAVARYNASGTLDTAGFGGGTGKVTTGVGSEAAASSVAIQPSDQKIVVAGSGTAGPNRAFAVVRYSTAGVPDGTFGGGDGIATTDFGDPNQGAEDIAIQSNGAIVAAGFRYGLDAPVPRCFTGPVDLDFALARYESDGDPDNTFSSNGRLTTDFGGGVDRAQGVGIQADGAIVAAGESAGDFALARYESDGDLDAGFNGDGRVTTDLGTGTCDEGNDVAISSILAAGTSDGRFALASYQQTTPAPPPTPTPMPTPLADSAPPETTITSGPKKKSRKRKATFGFVASEAGSSFECKLDNRQFQPCSAPKKYKKLRRGRHTFQVRATDLARNTDPTPATRSFKVLR